MRATKIITNLSFILSIIVIFIITILYFLKQNESFKELEIEKIIIHSLELNQKDFSIINDYNSALNNKQIIKSLEDKNTINEIKRIISNGKKRKFDYALNCTMENIYIPGTPNYILEIDSTKDTIYLFLWFYENQKEAFITYFNNLNRNEINKSKITNLVINEDDTKILKDIFIKNNLNFKN